MYHPFLTRYTAECMIIDNGPDLLIPSATGCQDEYALSVKLADIVVNLMYFKVFQVLSFCSTHESKTITC